MLINSQGEASDVQQPIGQNKDPLISLHQDGAAVTCRLTGAWNTRRVAKVDAQMRALQARPDIQTLEIDLAAITSLDTAGAWLIQRLIHTQRSRGADVSVSGESKAATVLLAAVEEAVAQSDGHGPRPRRAWIVNLLEAIGRTVYDARDDIVYGAHILGATIGGAQMKLGRAHAVNPAAIVNQIDRMGVGAVPIIVLMSAIVGAIIAQQGAFQLRYFGAEIFVVDLVGILILRELGVLMTAIMIAGRSGSAITAEIGSMKMREEVDALTVIGLNPVGVLVFPRLVALMIAVPCLTIVANFAALGGAMLITWLYSGIPPEAFIDRLRDSIDLSTIFAGLIKAPFMALIVGIIASVEGMKVGGSAESLGGHVTASVVKAIFIVIVVDGFFAIFYAAIDF
ncbi:ABC transporter permease [Nitratireductor sp. ZSWI3]|uniref:ABC transporter permease n=1 Tax=Nitratireductor sp. ZSWI3 TaxID=2966359 RepID=UPI00215064BC|nr:ABC transporter permease [Nitratireductor sp. ZSWI3]MCR4266663.1 ABC transporter permease [Nitratireductor sp. ZSWI3]